MIELACKLLLIGHGTLAQDMVNAAELVYGPVEDASVICLPADQDLEAYRDAITEEIRENAGDGLLILADFMGGTPFLTASRAMLDFMDQKVELVTGLNLPMLTAVCGERETGATARELAQCAVQAGTAGISDFRPRLEERRNPEPDC